MKNKLILEQIVPNVKVLNALRNSGYNNYTAIADIVDNSLEDDVESSKIIIRLPNKKAPFDFIKICDNGRGMDKISLKEAITLGSQTSKDLTTDLGCYGTGLKSASLSIGKRLVVKTKCVNDAFYIATFDMDELYEKNNWTIPIEEGNDEEYENFKLEIEGDHGTIIEISKLDRLTNNSVEQFSSLLHKNLGLIFKYFIDEKNITIQINDTKVLSIDPMQRNKSYVTRLSELNESFEYDNKKYTFNAYFLGREGRSDLQKINLDRNAHWCGLYIYRNLRLVGQAVGIGIYPRYGDGYSVGGRIELFINGEDDQLFGSVFNKIITEKDEKEGKIDQGFKDKVKDALKTYIASIRNKEREYSIKDAQNVDEEQKKIFEDIDANINKNKMLDVPKKGKNEPSETEKDVKHPRGTQTNPNPKKKRNEIWHKTTLENLGEFGKIFDIRIISGIHNVVINTGHVFWTEFLSTAPQETKEMFVKWMASSSISLWSLSFNNSEDVNPEHLMEGFHEKLSCEIRKMILF